MTISSRMLMVKQGLWGISRSSTLLQIYLTTSPTTNNIEKSWPMNLYHPEMTNSQKASTLWMSNSSCGKTPRLVITSNSKSTCFIRKVQAARSLKRTKRTFINGKFTSDTVTSLTCPKLFFLSSKPKTSTLPSCHQRSRWRKIHNVIQISLKGRSSFRATQDKCLNAWLTECHHTCLSSLVCTNKNHLVIIILNNSKRYRRLT